MNKNRFLTGRLGWVVGAALLAALTGCVGYVDQPRSRGAYYAEPGPREEVYVPAPPQQVEASVGSVGVSVRTEEDFYEPLGAYGRWEVVGTYGRCWIPGRVDAAWRPYSDGYWQSTDAGWYWVSDEPWAWATYHYGRWDLSPQFGWYWVPQTQWAPAWVSWHSGGGYIGWAASYPAARFAGRGSMEVDDRVISPRAYVFVEDRHFLEPVRHSTVVVNNTTIINKTVNITNIKVVNNTVINEGPATEVIEKASRRKVEAVTVRELRQKEEAWVVAKRKTPATMAEKKAGTPVRSEVQSREKKAVIAPVAPQVERPTAGAHESAGPAPKNNETQSEKPKPIPATAELKPEARPQANHAAAMKEPPGQKAGQQAKKQAKPAKPAKKKAHAEPVPPTPPVEPVVLPSSSNGQTPVAP